jgi:ubiquinone/menaquinone biosynthesis C-methylase UbiE
MEPPAGVTQSGTGSGIDAPRAARNDLRRYARYQGWDRRHLGTIRRFLDPHPGERILEVGCGPGHLTKRLQDLGCRAIGVDANPQAPDAAIARDVQVMRAERLEFADGSFDKVLAVHAIEHFPELPAALGEMARVLRPGGLMLLVYPAEPIRGLFATLDALVIYRNPLRARDLHLHKLRPARVRALADAVGLEHVHSEFNLFTSPQFVTLLRKPSAAP